ncbi:EscS/YscS/HrcS family type III secretion system export apparatus protein [Burkholderia sp. Tr-862]|jgi:type III secretion protein S|uniref:type III secretion system export apparatus subunit SctS n=1 Tax=Burkholderia TaxID=32008 RepID=UPI0004D97776|nr:MULTISPECIES: type III secretion system export apparatus subunit SctS [Burkholderia]KER67581.1 aldolase [Burkholderia cepacia]MBR8185349.1 type III secretion system export apparatus subunit SctS [Burkholderia ambifaria]NIF43152.1 EscS/YscS/HrcS family type III secretion system export apparatus protein [Burkholderia sp. Tr-862]PRG03967.1 EscS/YscS/HrcS family type III secretion system export apparatus protein [Burkholderia ambifaria]RQR49505.1 EscS/YscS/HrcS family type III secretion system 
MNTDDLIGLTTQGMLLCLYVSLPTIAVSALAGLLISFVQAITSLQDQSISHCFKLVAVLAVLALTGAWGGAAILRFATQLMTTAVPS